MLPSSPWNKRNTETLEKLWTDGWSASEIAAHLGVTRNAVMGKIHRMKMTRRRIKTENAVNPTRITPKPKKKRPINYGLPQVKRDPHKTVLPPVVVTKLDPDNPGIGIMSLTEETCKAVISTNIDAKARYCGLAVAAGKSFCAGHQSLYYYKHARQSGAA